jgi:DNA-binding transcriptional regulator YiaG
MAGMNQRHTICSKRLHENHTNSANGSYKGENMTGNDLKQLRKQHKLTQQQLAEKLRYNSKSYIARLEARKRRKLPLGVRLRVETLLK